MKRLLASFLAAILVFGCASADVDLTGMSLEELVALRDQVDVAIAELLKGKIVVLPAGVYQVGKDIPAGHWSITASKDDNIFGWSVFTYCSELDSTGAQAGNRWTMDVYYSKQVRNPESDAAVSLTNIDIEIEDGNYIIIEYAPLIFTPSTRNYGGKLSGGETSSQESGIEGTWLYTGGSGETAEGFTMMKAFGAVITFAFESGTLTMKYELNGEVDTVVCDYEIDGNKVTLIEKETSESIAGEFKVDGNRLTLDIMNSTLLFDKE